MASMFQFSWAQESKTACNRGLCGAQSSGFSPRGVGKQFNYLGIYLGREIESRRRSLGGTC